MSRLDPAHARRRERVIGGAVVLVGVAVLVLSIVALVVAGDRPSSDVAGPTVTLPGAGTSSSSSTSTSPSPTGSGSGSSTPTDTGSGSGTPSGTSSSPSTGGAVGSQPLVVLNNTGESGLAQQVAQTFTAGGWTVTETGNITQSTVSTCAYYDPDVAGAQAAAEALRQQFPAIKRTVAKYGGLPAGPVVVVLTSDYTAQ